LEYLGEKILARSSPPRYRRSRPAVKSKIGPYVGRIVQMLDEDRGKQFHAAKRILERLRAEGSTGVTLSSRRRCGT
jgi:hypothetical protein